ncbi:GAF domain-containing protein, partial [Salmonella enterica subsp. enterica serovar Weltevreden]|uniref:GAF domain-containing protein n=1 Tax=Salmonella enterica TaxID=28901 RepID=UPI0029C5D4DB
MPADPSLPVNQVLERQAPLLLREGEVRALLDAPRDPEYGRLITALMWREVLVAPMVVHGRMIGAISCTIGTAGRSYDERDLDLACDMAARAAL